ncbi:MAG: amidohydrolase family protein [Syntrophales bacterium]|nr:amidohydrolase family protein [Syntrophales bacterium]
MAEEKKIDLKEIKAVDCSLLPHYCGMPQRLQDTFKYWEFQIMAITTFAGVFRKVQPKPGEEWKVLGAACKSSVEEAVAEMDEVGIDYAICPMVPVWSQRDHAMMMGYSLEEVAEICKKSNGRIIGGAAYNPFRIKESLEEIERAVKEYGFKYVWFHPISFGLRPDDRRNYPLYAKCLELGIPVGMQVGHSAEPLTSEPGHPMYADVVAIDFPDLAIILTHTGYPWIEEWCSMIWRHPNVYGMLNAYMPSGLEPATIRFVDSPRGRDKVLWGSHAFGITRWKQEFLGLPIREDTKIKVLRDNAIKLFKLG